MLTIHGRTRKEGFAGKADWEMIGRIKNLLEIPVIANGDIKNPLYFLLYYPIQVVFLP